MILPVVERDKNNILLEEVVWPEEEACAATHDEGLVVEVDHHGTLLGVKLGAVHVEVEAVLVSDGGDGGEMSNWGQRFPFSVASFTSAQESTA